MAIFVGVGGNTGDLIEHPLAEPLESDGAKLTEELPIVFQNLA